MKNVKCITQIILYNTIIATSILLYIKYTEIQRGYPRHEFCVTCPNLPFGSVQREVEECMNFNLLIVFDFITMMFITLIFANEQYYRHPTCLFTLHVCRFIFNATSFTTSEILDKVLKPVIKQLFGHGAENFEMRSQAQTIVGLLYIIYLILLFVNFAISIFLLCFYDPYRYSIAPVIVRVDGNSRRSRAVFRIDQLSPFNNTPYSSFDRSPSPPKFTEVVIPTSKQRKYHLLDSCDTYSFRHSKHKVLPIPQLRPQMIQA